MYFEIKSFKNGGKIPEKYAFCKPDEKTKVTFSQNLNPHLVWGDLPKGTKSLAIICYDPDVPSVGDDVNVEGKIIPADLPRVKFYHWLLCNIPININEIPEGELSNGVVAHGKSKIETQFGHNGINNYTDWFAGDENMKGDYFGYDGPCPPWNDEIIHHYHFVLYALNSYLVLPEKYKADNVLKEMEDKIIEQMEWVGTYTLNKNLK
jgi:Raf kinase inhibitor-like YbhB/YbcL family protein